MTTYSEDALRKLNKDDLIGIALSLQGKMESSNAKVLEELKLLNDKFDKIEADVAIARNAKSLLLSRLVDTLASSQVIFKLSSRIFFTYLPIHLFT